MSGGARHVLIQSHDVHHKVHGSGRIGRFNTRIAVRLTQIVGTVWCAYAFTALSLYGLPAALQGGAGGFVQWASSQFIQLVLLPVIIVGQNVQAAASDARAETDHDILKTLHEINIKQTEILRRLEERPRR